MNMRTEYRIVGRFRKDDKKHVVDWNRKWNLEDAKRRLAQLEEKSQLEMRRHARTTDYSNGIGVATEYYSEYDLLDLEIQSRQVSPWSTYQEDC